MEFPLLAETTAKAFAEALAKEELLLDQFTPAAGLCYR